jgi:tetratricopeptide (TPR) repeat protein
LSTKAEILAKLGRNQEANSIMETAIKLPSATALAIHQYGRQLLAAKKVDEAFAVFQYNASRYKDEWPVHVGLARGYAAKGDTKQALEHAKKAVEQAPDPLNKQSLEAMVKALESGQPIN